MDVTDLFVFVFTMFKKELCDYVYCNCSIHDHYFRNVTFLYPCPIMPSNIHNCSVALLPPGGHAMPQGLFSIEMLSIIQTWNSVGIAGLSMACNLTVLVSRLPPLYAVYSNATI